MGVGGIVTKFAMFVVRRVGRGESWARPIAPDTRRVPAYTIIKIISVYRAFSHRYPGAHEFRHGATRNKYNTHIYLYIYTLSIYIDV